MRDLFDRMRQDKGPLGKWADIAEGYFAFPKLEGSISNRMKFNGKEVITWSVNDYLGLANDPEVRKVDAEAAATPEKENAQRNPATFIPPLRAPPQPTPAPPPSHHHRFR